MIQSGGVFKIITRYQHQYERGVKIYVI